MRYVKNLALYNPPSSFPQGSGRGFLVLTKTIPLTKGKSTIVDEDDFAKFGSLKWMCHCGYARRGKRVNGKMKTIHLSHLILGVPNNQQVDHINGNRLDNRKCNLRVCSPGQNAMNASKRSDNKSGFKGVSLYRAKKWRAYIQAGRKWMHLGYFDDIVTAAKAYDVAAKELHGEYARTNF